MCVFVSKMSALALHAILPGLCALFSGLLCFTSAEEEFRSRSGPVQELRGTLSELAGEGRAFLGRLAGEQTLLSVHKAFSQVLAVTAESLASSLNVILRTVSHLLQATGLQVGVPLDRVTPDGVVFVVQWVLFVLIGYCLLSITLQLVASVLRRALWLLKVGVALGGFGLILSDQDAGPETTAGRLAMLVCLCVLLGVGRGRGPDPASRTAHLEEQVKILERRLREMERRRRTEE